ARARRARRTPRRARHRARPRAGARDTRAAPPTSANAFDFQQLRDRRRGLRALAEPVAHLRLVELDRRGIRLRVVPPDDLDELAVARGARVGHDDAVDRVLLRPDARQPHPYRQTTYLLALDFFFDFFF